METVIGAAALIVSLSLIWSGRQRLEFTSFQTTLLTILEFFGVVASVVGLGWFGLTIFVALNVIAVLVWSAVLAAKKQSILVGAAVASAEMDRDDIEQLWGWTNRRGAFAVLGPLERAELIKALAGQARRADEIRPMALAVAQLSVIFGCDAIWLATRFDQLLRLYGKGAPDSEEVADTLTAATQNSAADFKDMLEAMIVAAGGSFNARTNEAVIGRKAA